MPPHDPPHASTTRPELGRPQAVAAMSGHLDTRTAAMEVADGLAEGLERSCDLLLLFASFHHRAAFADAVTHIRQTVAPRTLLGSTAESVLGEEGEREGRSGLSALALTLPDVRLHAWRITPQDPLPDAEPRTVRKRLGIGDEHRVTLLVADPFTTPMQQLLPAINAAAEPDRPIPVVGGMASGASQPGHNALALNEQISSAGAFGVSLSGNVTVDTLVSQGCRPIGKPAVVTKVKGNVLLELGGQTPMAVLKEAAIALDEQDRALLNRGLLVGVVIDEYKERFGRGDFLVRNVTGIDTKLGVVRIADDQIKVGQTVQFHVRDARTASEDLQLLLDAQQLESAPFAALLFTCNGRGTRLFAEPHHDVQALRDRLGEVPVAGFFAAGEIGPIGDRSFLHGHTASIALLRGAPR